MKITILDGYTENPGDLSWDWLGEFGEADIYDRTPPDDAEVIRRIGDADMDLTAEERHTIHGNNERIRLETALRAVEFFLRVMKQC